jgi:ketosteroid isomerase-like protein
VKSAGREPIRPAAAGTPAEALAFLCDSLSDGDLEAAAALYEPRASLSLVPERRCSGPALLEALADLIKTRLAVEVTLKGEAVAGDLALVFALRSVTGTTPEGKFLDMSGAGVAVLRERPGKGWRFALDHWQLEDGTRGTG